MNEEFSQSFWLGNAILAIALLMLLFMGSLWEALGVLAMVLWAAVVALGVYLVLNKPQKP
jgi:predicted RND superfamily exporter protein